MLLIRGEPFTGESLSSYRQRIWMRNGYRLFPVFRPELRRTDPDLQSRSQVFDAVAQQLGQGNDMVAALSLRAHPLLSAQNPASRSNFPRWVVLLQYARSGIGAGSMFCPTCLLHCEEPYFRAAWRLSVNLTCHLHQVQMLDRCPACSFPAWPYAAASGSGFFSKQLDLDQCPRCLFRLRESPSTREDGSELLACSEVVASGKSSWSSGPLKAMPIHEYFGGLRATMNVALKTRSRRKVMGSQAFGGVVDELNQKGIERTSFDRLDVRYRRKLMSSAWPLMDNWPNRFLEFARHAGLTAVDFSEERDTAPSWFMQAVDNHLGQPGRSVTPARVEMAIQLLSHQGRPVNAEAVGRMVGSREAKAVQARLGKRSAATANELMEMIAGLQRYMGECTSRRQTALFVRARNVVTVGIAILGQMSMEDAMEVKRADLQRIVAPVQCNPSLSRYLRPAVETALNTMAPFWSDRAVGVDGSFFVPHRGSLRNLRGPQEALRHAMKGLDSRLWRGHWVFFDPK